MANTNIDTYIAILLTFFILRCKMWGCAHFQLYTSPLSYDLIICWNNENDESSETGENSDRTTCHSQTYRPSVESMVDSSSVLQLLRRRH